MNRGHLATIGFQQLVLHWIDVLVNTPGSSSVCLKLSKPSLKVGPLGNKLETGSTDPNSHASILYDLQPKNEVTAKTLITSNIISPVLYLLTQSFLSPLVFHFTSRAASNSYAATFISTLGMLHIIKALSSSLHIYHSMLNKTVLRTNFMLITSGLIHSILK